MRWNDNRVQRAASFFWCKLYRGVPSVPTTSNCVESTINRCPTLNTSCIFAWPIMFSIFLTQRIYPVWATKRFLNIFVWFNHSGLKTFYSAGIMEAFIFYQLQTNISTRKFTCSKKCVWVVTNFSLREVINNSVCTISITHINTRFHKSLLFNHNFKNPNFSQNQIAFPKIFERDFTFGFLKVVFCFLSESSACVKKCVLVCTNFSLRTATNSSFRRTTRTDVHASLHKSLLSHHISETQTFLKTKLHSQKFLKTFHFWFSKSFSRF